MKNQKMAMRMQQRLSPSYSSLQIIGQHSLISIQSLSTCGDRKWSASVFHSKEKTYSCQMTLRENASPKRGNLVTPNQHKFLIWRDSQNWFYVVRSEEPISQIQVLQYCRIQLRSATKKWIAVPLILYFSISQA